MFKNVSTQVLSVDGRKVFLTQKKSLVSSKYPTLLHYNQCVPGLVTEGVIYKILEHGLVIRFFGDVQVIIQKHVQSSVLIWKCKEMEYEIGLEHSVAILRF